MDNNSSTITGLYRYPIQEAEKLYNKLTKELGDEIISDYVSSAPSANQTHTHTEELRLNQK